MTDSKDKNDNPFGSFTLSNIKYFGGKFLDLVSTVEILAFCAGAAVCALAAYAAWQG